MNPDDSTGLLGALPSDSAAAPVSYDTSTFPNATPASGGAIATLEAAGGALIQGAVALVPDLAKADLSSSRIARAAAFFKNLPFMAGPWGFVVRLLLLIAATNVGEWIIGKLWEAISGTYTGLSDDPNDPQTAEGATGGNYRDLNAAAYALNLYAKQNPAAVAALAYIRSGQSSLNAVSFLKLSAESQKFVEFYQAATDRALMQAVQFRISGPFEPRNPAQG